VLSAVTRGSGGGGDEVAARGAANGKREVVLDASPGWRQAVRTRHKAPSTRHRLHRRHGPFGEERFALLHGRNGDQRSPASLDDAALHDVL
jgi:hypothetical protein